MCIKDYKPYTLAGFEHSNSKRLVRRVRRNLLTALQPFVFDLKTSHKIHVYIHEHACTIKILVLERICLSCSCKHFGQKNLVKSLLISTLDKVIYYIGTFLQGSTKPLFASQNRVKAS
jgi:hypothetical protein